MATKPNYDLIIAEIQALYAEFKAKADEYYKNLPPEAQPVKEAFDSILNDVFASRLPTLRAVLFAQIKSLIDTGYSPVAKSGADVA